MARQRKSAGERRQEIFAAAEALFVAKGYDAVVMDEIAQACGLARTTLYEYYPNKEALLAGLIERLMSGAPDLPEGGGSCRDQLAAFAGAQLSFIQEHRVIYRLVFQKLPSLGGPVAQSVAERQQAQSARILALVTNAQLQGECRPDLTPAEIAFAYQALVGQLGSTLLTTERVIEPAAEAARLLDLLWRGVGNP